MATRLKNIDPTTLYIDNPVAEYNRVQKMQKALAKKVTWLEKAFGIAYREQNRGLEGFRPELYLGNNEYIEVFPDDSITGMCFFDVEDLISRTGDADRNFVATINIIFFVNLGEAYPSLQHRADAEARQEVINVLRKYDYGFSINNIVKGVDNVYDRYSWTKPHAKIDKQPFHVFAIECDVTYDCYNY